MVSTHRELRIHYGDIMRTRCVLAGLLLCLLAACGGGDSDGPPTGGGGGDTSVPIGSDIGTPACSRLAQTPQALVDRMTGPARLAGFDRFFSGLGGSGSAALMMIGLVGKY